MSQRNKLHIEMSPYMPVTAGELIDLVRVNGPLRLSVVNGNLCIQNQGKPYQHRREKPLSYDRNTSQALGILLHARSTCEYPYAWDKLARCISIVERQFQMENNPQ